MIAAGAVVAAAGLAVRQVRARRPLLDTVRPELRHPVLYLPMDLRSDRTLRVVRKLAEVNAKVDDGVTCTQRTLSGAPDVDVTVYEPPQRAVPSAALLWMHGGGLVLGTPGLSNQYCSSVAKELGMLVVSVDYRLAPEDPFPAGLDDCAVALRWLHDRAAELGVDPDRLAVGGESAGGGLAAALAQRTHDEGGPALAFQLLVYPMLDDRTVLRAAEDGREGLVWTAASNAYAWTAYLGHAPSWDDERPYAAPGRREDLSGLPPAWIGVGDVDLFHQEDLDYAARLVGAGVPCELHVEPGMYHGADGVRMSDPSMRAFRAGATAALGAAVARATA
jgi:acetyl esterase/lipase